MFLMTNQIKNVYSIKKKKKMFTQFINFIWAIIE